MRNTSWARLMEPGLHSLRLSDMVRTTIDTMRMNIGSQSIGNLDNIYNK